MAVCAAYGIRHSEFAHWDRDDRDKAVWWEIHRRESCPDCGTRPDEWDPELGGHDYAYVAELSRCHGCVARSAAEKGITDEMGAGIHPVLVRNPEAR